MTHDQIREELQRAISGLIDRGEAAEDVLDQALTVAIAGLATLHGPRRAAASLAAASGGLMRLAEQAERDSSAPRH